MNAPADPGLDPDVPEDEHDAAPALSSSGARHRREGPGDGTEHEGAMSQFQGPKIDLRTAAIDEFNASNHLAAAVFAGLGAVDQLAALVQEQRTANLIAAVHCGVFDNSEEYVDARRLVMVRLGLLAPSEAP